MTLEQRVEALEFKVEFPEKNGLSFTMNKDLAMKFIQRIGSNVSVNIGSKTLANIPYSEELTTDFTLEGYNQRAKLYAEKMVAKIFEAAQKQAAHKMNITNDEVKIVDKCGSIRVSLGPLW
ncbi:TPA: hypothetical protein ACY3ID_004158 [Citrobacter amalonaticus]|uniref:hypothetical protein n=1 Tax=Citrobacter TaxID=544 RepID=UPI000AF402E6|nr:MULTISPECIES: hypothetical protein [Citrobacter]EKJ4549824.1 hypothetical protein [Escherichia coli]MBE0394846.1 hypothetical protein [Citrobacter amalonaticus]MBJ9137921.1 hypothetical protein [Citrobacter farmeri]MDT7070846.1 hypothetical protein [Citrobacter amalonaticus]QMK79474.1 hypothetical protein HVX64_17515 [Citrobacter sp. RHB20-C16]